MSENVIFDKQEDYEVVDEKRIAYGPLVGTILFEKYSVTKLLAYGGVFTMYLVKDLHSGKEFAMKVLDKSNANFEKDRWSIVYDAIRKEACVMMKMDHPLIPRIVDVNEDDTYFCIVQEYFEGRTLDSIVKMQGAQPVEKVVEWGKQLCDFLTYLHEQNPPYIHRDMQPGNILMMSNGKIKVIHFGIMKEFNPADKMDICCFGTKGYAAPEQYGTGPSDMRTDIYSLGMTMHNLITGASPAAFPYETLPIGNYNPDFPKGLEYIISKCIQPNPNDRYQSCKELKADLDNYLKLSPKKGLFSKLFKK